MLGRGASGTVYLADTVSTGLPRKVAIKVLNSDLNVNAGLVGRLNEQAKSLSQVNHRAMVRVDDIAQLNGQWSVLMEYVEGADLSSLLKDGPLPPGRPSRWRRRWLVRFMRPSTRMVRMASR